MLVVKTEGAKVRLRKFLKVRYEMKHQPPVHGLFGDFGYRFLQKELLFFSEESELA